MKLQVDVVGENQLKQTLNDVNKDLDKLNNKSKTTSKSNADLSKSTENLSEAFGALNVQGLAVISTIDLLVDSYRAFKTQINQAFNISSIKATSGEIKSLINQIKLSKASISDLKSPKKYSNIFGGEDSVKTTGFAKLALVEKQILDDLRQKMTGQMVSPEEFGFAKSFRAGLEYSKKIAEEKIKELKISMIKQFASFSVIKLGISIAITAGSIAVLNSMSKWAAELEDPLDHIGDAFGDLSEEQLKTVDATAKLVNELGAFNKIDTIEALSQLGEAGYSFEDSLKMITEISKFAIANQMKLGDATNKTSKVMDGLGLKSKDAAENMKNMIAIHDMVSVATKKTSGSASNYMDALIAASGSMTTYGESVNDVIPILMALERKNISGTEAGQVYTLMMRMLGKAVGDNAKDYENLGIKLYDTNGKFVGLTSVIGQMKEKFSGMSDQQRNAALQTLGLGKQIDNFNKLIQGSDNIKEFGKDIENSVGETSKQAAEELQKYNVKMQQLKNTFDEYKQKLGNAVLPYMSAFVSLLKKGLEWIVRINESKFGGFLLDVAAGVLIAVTTLGALATILYTIQAIIIMTKFIAGKGLIGIILGAAAVGGTFAIIKSFSNKFKQEVDDVIKDAQKKVQAGEGNTGDINEEESGTVDELTKSYEDLSAAIDEQISGKKDLKSVNEEIIKLNEEEISKTEDLTQADKDLAQTESDLSKQKLDNRQKEQDALDAIAKAEADLTKLQIENNKKIQKASEDLTQSKLSGYEKIIKAQEDLDNSLASSEKKLRDAQVALIEAQGGDAEQLKEENKLTDAQEEFNKALSENIKLKQQKNAADASGAAGRAKNNLDDMIQKTGVDLTNPVLKADYEATLALTEAENKLQEAKDNKQTSEKEAQEKINKLKEDYNKLVNDNAISEQKAADDYQKKLDKRIESEKELNIVLGKRILLQDELNNKGVGEVTQKSQDVEKKRKKYEELLGAWSRNKTPENFNKAQNAWNEYDKSKQDLSKYKEQNITNKQSNLKGQSPDTTPQNNTQGNNTSIDNSFMTEKEKADIEERDKQQRNVYAAQSAAYYERQGDNDKRDKWRAYLKDNRNRASGGSVSANSPYIVGEAGMEVFVPSQSGRIIPNSQIGSNSSSSPMIVELRLEKGLLLESAGEIVGSVGGKQAVVRIIQEDYSRRR